METIKKFYILIGEITNPMRSWKYAEYINYVHIFIGFVVVGLFVILILVTNPTGLNVVGISLSGLALGIAIERLQYLIGIRNTVWKRIGDIYWTTFGASLVGQIAFYFDVARWVY